MFHLLQSHVTVVVPCCCNSLFVVVAIIFSWCFSCFSLMFQLLFFVVAIICSWYFNFLHPGVAAIVPFCCCNIYVYGVSAALTYLLQQFDRCCCNNSSWCFSCFNLMFQLLFFRCCNNIFMVFQLLSLMLHLFFLVVAIYMFMVF
jgi:hypothetical protein